MYCTFPIDKILLLGSGGHCGVIIDALRRSHKDVKIGLVAKAGEEATALDAPVVGTDDDLPRLFLEGWHYAFVAVGSVGHTALRRRLAEKLKQIGFTLPVIADPSARISPTATLGAGTFVAPLATVNSAATVGEFAIINTGAIVEHQCRLGDFVHTAPGSVLCGGVTVGDDTHIGARTVVAQELTVGARALIGMGSVVTRSIPDGVVAFGAPCRVQREHK